MRDDMSIAERETQDKMEEERKKVTEARRRIDIMAEYLSGKTVRYESIRETFPIAGEDNINRASRSGYRGLGFHWDEYKYFVVPYVPTWVQVLCEGQTVTISRESAKALNLIK